MKKYGCKLFALLFISIIIEVLFFNYRAMDSLGAHEQHPEFVMSGNMLYVNGMKGNGVYLYLDVSNTAPDAGQLPLSFTLSIVDEGNSEGYELNKVTFYPVAWKSKYYKINSYGEVSAMTVEFEQAYGGELSVNDVVWDARVPWDISLIRILSVTAFFYVLYILRPTSGIYTIAWTDKKKKAAAGCLMLCCLAIFAVILCLNPVFRNPVWPYHEQYHRLAQALSEGRFNIEFDNGDAEMTNAVNALATLENPYDFNERVNNIENYSIFWDIAYYNGKFYVYFGIVPVLLFYLPYYLIFNSAFPTWIGVFIASAFVLFGAFYLLWQIRERWFRNINFTYYLLLTWIFVNTLNLLCALGHPDFYYLPIVSALAFSLWGIGFLIAFVRSSEEKHDKGLALIFFGALCLALTAGCRPQFLIGSFLVLPLILPIFWRDKKNIRTAVLRCACFVLPYILVAAGLMYYNYARFGSAFDFGANYNLTTNDMTLRGFNLERLPDGIFAYIFQPINLTLEFPFIRPVIFSSTYMGNTVAENIYGGVFGSHIILTALVGIADAGKKLKEKKIFMFTVLSLIMAFVVVAADTELAGILTRYNTDFLWLFTLPAVIVLFQLLESYNGKKAGKYITAFIIFAMLWGFFCELAIAVNVSEIAKFNVHRFYMLKNML